MGGDNASFHFVAKFKQSDQNISPG
jgi:hypothetical protein